MHVQGRLHVACLNSPECARLNKSALQAMTCPVTAAHVVEGDIIDCIDYVTGIGNVHSIYWHSVFLLRAHLQSFLAQPPPTLTLMPLS